MDEGAAGSAVMRKTDERMLAMLRVALKMETSDRGDREHALACLGHESGLHIDLAEHLAAAQVRRVD